MASEYVIKLKGTNIYLVGNIPYDSLSTNKSEAKVYKNPKTDIIGKLDKDGHGPNTEDKSAFRWVSKTSNRGKEVIKVLLANPDLAKKLKESTYRYSVYDEITSSDFDDYKLIEVWIPYEYLEREEL